MARRRKRQSDQGVAYCVIAQVAFDRYVRTMRVPEEWIPRVTEHGWIVLIRDSEMPSESVDPSQSNPRRHEDDIPEDGA